MQNEVHISTNYTFYSDGTLYNRRTKNYRKWFRSGSGYLCSSIYINGGTLSVLQHRLLAEHFIPNPENKKEVNHINGIKNDNRLSNLEWVSASENRKHALQTGLQKPRYKKVVDDKEGTIYKSVKEAAEHHNMGKDYLYMMLRGVRKNKTNLQFLNQ